MAEVLETFPATKHMDRREWGYAQYMDGRVYRLRGGVDCAPSFATAGPGLYMAAARAGKKCHIHSESRNPLVIVVQAYTPDPASVG